MLCAVCTSNAMFFCGPDCQVRCKFEFEDASSNPGKRFFFFLLRLRICLFFCHLVFNCFFFVFLLKYCMIRVFYLVRMYVPGISLDLHGSRHISAFPVQEQVQGRTIRQVGDISCSSWSACVVPFVTRARAVCNFQGLMFVISRGRAGYTIILYDFPPDIFFLFVFLQQLCCVQYNRAVGTTPYGKRHISRPNLLSLCSLS